MFYDTLPRHVTFSDLTDPGQYAALPQDWVIGTSDIIGSTHAIAGGKYKVVNMIGAAVISAQINAAGGRAFPYVFSGDGAAFAHPAAHAAAARAALAAVQVWAHEEFDLGLRVGLFPVADIRAAGRNVSVARYQVSEGLDFAMFSGGGVRWAEAQMKAGAVTVPPAPSGTQPDLTGLSCRWSHMAARNGTILSLLVQPCEGVPDTAFADLAQQVLDNVRHLERDGHPAPAEGPGTGWPPPGAILEAHASHGALTLAKRKRQILFETAIAWVLLKTGLRIGGFDPVHYRRTVAGNADFRKFDDGLKMTLDCDPDTVKKLTAILDAAKRAGLIRYGLHTQNEAMMTCIVPSIMHDSHVHFIDGAAGGYAQAAMSI